MSNLPDFLLSFGFNLLIALLVVRFVYYPTTHDKSYVFTFLVFNTIIYFVLSFLTSIEIGIGVGFGLFAIFSILRYRTETIPIREMTYLFVISALAVMNSAGFKGEIGLPLIAANVVILALMLVLEKEWGFCYEASQRIVYEKIELVRLDRRAELLADLEARTGLKIKRVAVGRLDFLRDVVNLKIFYDKPQQADWVLNGEPDD
jgi:hypothetical protein